MATIKSIEEKAKAYDKAISIAKKEFNACGSQNCDATRQIFRLFPELAESEDERIRKGIIRNLEYLADRAEGFVKDELKERIAWLEKQGEQPKKHDVCDNCDQQGSCVSPCPMKLVENQGEQEPVEWSEEDEDNLRKARFYVNYYQTHEADSKEAELCDNWLKSLKERMKIDKKSLYP